MPRRWRRLDPALAVLALLLLVRLLWLAPRLIVDDLNLDYPFAAGDAWDWIANGLYYTGEDVRFSARPPLVPLAMAALASVGWLEAFPLLVQGLWTATLLVLYRLLARHWSAAVALSATLVLAASETLNLLSLELMADLPAACLMLLALAAVAAAGERPRRYLAAGVLAGLALLASPVGLTVVPAAALAVVVGRRRHLREPALWAAGATVAVAVGGWWLARRMLVGGRPSLRDPGDLLRFRLEDLDGTLWMAAVLVGWPALVLVLVGTVVALRRAATRRDPGQLRLLALIASALPLAFFAVVYDFPDRRFLAYPALPAAVLFAEGLASLRPPAGRAVAGVAAVVWAAWPLATPLPHSLLVLPPALYAQARSSVTREGALRIEPATAALRRRGVERVMLGSWWSRVARRHREETVDDEVRAARRGRREAARRAGTAAAGVLFLDSAIRPFDRYRAQSQLGNLLGRRVRFVPQDLFAGRWGWLAGGGVEPVAQVGGYLLWQVAPSGVEGSWLLATQAPPAAREPPPAPVAAEASGDGVAASAVEPPGRGDARRLAGALPGATLRVAVVLPPGPVPPLAVWLPFELDTTELFVLDEADAAAGAGLFTPAPGAVPHRFGAACLVERRWRGRPVRVVELGSPERCR